jgi:hypothetical protein
VNYIIDTNIFYHLPELNVTNNSILLKLKERIDAGDMKIYYTPISIVEIGSRLEREPAMFASLKHACQILIDFKAYPLPDPDRKIFESLYGEKIPTHDLKLWEDYLYTISKAPDIKSLENGFEDYETFTKRWVNLKVTSEFRDQFEKDFINDLYKITVYLNPTFEKKLLANKNTRLNKEGRDSLDIFLNSKEWDNIFLSSLLYKIPPELLSGKNKLNYIWYKDIHYFTTYETLLKSIFFDGYIANIKKKNDRNDLDFLIYLNSDITNVLVSEDQNKMFQEARADNRCIFFQEFIKSI